MAYRIKLCNVIKMYRCIVANNYNNARLFLTVLLECFALLTLFWVRIRVGSVFVSLLDPDPWRHSKFGSGSRYTVELKKKKFYSDLRLDPGQYNTITASETPHVRMQCYYSLLLIRKMKPMAISPWCLPVFTGNVLDSGIAVYAEVSYSRAELLA